MKNRSVCSIHEAVKCSLEGIRIRGEYGLRHLRLVVAVSGGVDSVSLLHALVAVQDRVGVELFVAHLDHGLRRESRSEAEVVRRLAEQNRLSFLTERAPSMPQGVNLEAWARGVRYEFLERCRASVRGDFILTAHHQNDQGETVLFRLLSGRIASQGYAIATFDPRRHLLRPLLAVSRRELEEYARKHSLLFVTDDSNFDLSRTRNRIRHLLLPELAHKYNPGILRSLSEVGERLADDEDLLWSQAREAANKLPPTGALTALAALPPPLQWRALRTLCERSIGEEGRKLGYRALRRFLQENFNCEGCGAQRGIDLGFGIRCRVGSRGELLFSLTAARSLCQEARERGQAEHKTPSRRSWAKSAPDPSSTNEALREAFSEEALQIPGRVVRRYGEGLEGVVEARFFERGRGEPFDWGLLERDLIAPSHGELSGNGAGSASEGGAEGARSRTRFIAIFDGGFFRDSHLIVRERREGDSMRVWRRGSRKVKKLFQEKGVSPSLRSTIPVVEFEGEILWIPGIARSHFAPVTEATTVILELRASRVCAALSGSRSQI